MLQSRVLAMRAAPRLAMRHTPALHLHTVVPRENPAAFVVLGGVALVAVGLNYAYKTLMKGGGPSTGSMPAGYVPHPGVRDSHTATLQKVFYEGGFEDKMTKGEAAKILGVRESAPRDRILERYRTLMKINHPDRGGSPLLSLKVNEAKEMLAKTAKEGDKGARRR